MSDKEKIHRFKAIYVEATVGSLRNTKRKLWLLSKTKRYRKTVIHARIEVIQCLLEEKLKTLNSIDQEVLTLCLVEERN